MRKFISLILASGLFFGGSAAAIYFLFFAPGWRGLIVMGCGFAATLGAYWLYEDFLRAPDNA